MSDPRDPPAEPRTVDERVAETEVKLADAEVRLAAAERENTVLRASLERLERARELEARNERRMVRRLMRRTGR